MCYLPAKCERTRHKLGSILSPGKEHCFGATFVTTWTKIMCDIQVVVREKKKNNRIGVYEVDNAQTPTAINLKCFCVPLFQMN